MNTNDKIKFQLNNKAENVLNSREENFKSELKIFFDFIKNTPLLNAILIELEQMTFDLDKYLQDGRHRRFIHFPDNYNEKMSLCLKIMGGFIESKFGALSGVFLNITSSRNPDEITRTIARQYFYPLFIHFYEGIIEQSNMLYLLTRYRYRTEWFHKERLMALFQTDTKHGEDNLTLDLQEYLHSQGIDYPFSTPHSPSGRADLVGLLESADPMVLEVKLFNLAQGYDKGYIRKGLTQAYRYSIDYGKPAGYLLIYNLDSRDINFEGNEVVKTIILGNKIIYIIVVNIFDNGKTASELKKPLPYIIEDSFLINLEE